VKPIHKGSGTRICVCAPSRVEDECTNSESYYDRKTFLDIFQRLCILLKLFYLTLHLELESSSVDGAQQSRFKPENGEIPVSVKLLLKINKDDGKCLKNVPIATTNHSSDETILVVYCRK
jgi:hypothetical protein